MRRLLTVLLFVTAAASTAATSAQAQAVRGRVLDADTRQPIAGVQIRMSNARDVVVAEAVTGEEGLFHVAAREAGQHRIDATHIGYTSLRTAVIEIRRAEQVVVDLTMSTKAIVLEPLTVTARRRDPRHDASYEGLYARRATLPPIGSRRAVISTDPEMASSSTVRETLNWFEARSAPCMIVFFNGRLVQSPELVQAWVRETSVSHLEGIEYYRRWSDAPFALRDVPFYVFDPWPCSVVAVWPLRPAALRPPGG